MGVSMNSKRSYLDTLNAGRPRKPHTTLEELNRSLENLEQRLSQPQDFSRERDDMRRQQRFADLPYGEPRRDDFRAAAPQPAAPRASYDQPYQTLARDLDRVRAQEDGVAAFGKIAAELKALREDLRQQVTSGMRREFEAVREDIKRAYASGAKGGADELGVEFERLSSAIHSLSERSDDKSINMLRLELEQVKGALDTLAREETVRSVDRRWDDFNKRWTDFEDRISTGSHDPAISALTSRLEQINDAVNNLPESLSLRSLEEKVRTLAAAVDHFARQQEHADVNTFGQIEERLDEISRAIVASTAAAKLPNFDPAPFERIEARISALARQIEEVAGDQPTGGEVMERLNLLSSRVDQITQQIHLPEAAVERLGKQIAIIADKIDRTPAAAPDADYIFQGIEQRFDLLSSMIERRQGDAAEQSNMLFRDLERRLDEVADRLDQRAQAPVLDNSGIMDAIDARFATLAERLESRRPEPADNAAIRSLEARLENISSRLDSSASQFANIDPDLIRNLEAQVSGLSQHLARPSSPLPEFEDIGPRLDDIERSIAGSHESILEAARHAAENAVRSLAGSQTQGAAVSGLADDLKALEALTRRSDERNTKTFEAIHDTLLKIVDRLGSLEQDERPAGQADPEPLNTLRKMALQDTPSLDFDDGLPLVEGEDRPSPSRGGGIGAARTPAQAAAAAASAALDSDTIADDEPETGSRSMFGGLGRVFKGRKGQAAAQAATAAPAADAVAAEEAPSVDLDEPLDPKLANKPLAPGSGAPDLNAIMRRVRDERGQPAKPAETEAAKADFIAAARRAAQAAAAEAEALKRESNLKGPVRALRLGDLLKARRKPILMAAAAIMMALAGLQLGKAFMADDTQVAEVASPPAIEQPAKQPEHASMAQVQQTSAPVQLDSLAEARGDASAVRNVDDAQQTAAIEPETTPEEATAVIAEPVPGTETTASTPVAEAAPETPSTTAATSAEPVPAGPVTAFASPVMAPAGLAAMPATPEPAQTTAASVPVEAGPVALREAASSGDAKALFEIGSRYADGRGVKSDMKGAAEWYEKSAELGFAPAQYRIGNFYEKGLGVERDVEKAKTWYQLAASQGNASAMHNLAVLFAMGADGTADNESAARWFIQAAELGVKDSQFNLGILAAKGVGMPQNLEESYKWFALVAKTGDKDASAKRDEIANALRPEQLERARAATELWKAKPLDAASNSVEIPEAWQESQGATASVDMKKAVRNIQAILNKNGYDAGGADGVMGQKTKNAIAAFQKANGMDANGEIDEKVVRALLALNK
jgi:localization factor PodJL